ncbi:hypothetical protein [Pelomonas sp. Root1237]|uniref:hypothetical protein n=1 Tax=Pelomonas sp. Root1237 TaxID=1736434 RepID=UPI000AECA1B7|nr:hypothetical protein [Pelomonas sp. Root1237]
MNNNKRYGAWWLRMAALYLVVGVSLGNYMGATHDFGLRSVHAHVNLLGWASMLGFGLVVQQLADTLSPRLVALQFWLHQLALPVMLSALAALMRGNTAAGPLVGLGSVVVGVAVLAFAANVWRGTGAKLRAA